MYCHEALHLKQKLQRAGYKQQSLVWDSDSDDGEDSGDELEDLMA